MRRITGKTKDETLIELQSATESQKGDVPAVLTAFTINLHSEERKDFWYGSSSKPGPLPLTAVSCTVQAPPQEVLHSHHPGIIGE
ncbi:hypothetical protein NQZ68_036178 [Dissostichus eleginoides]|nr:hypothetical protein NQZ68_036178 [Dissostichus eleginoides]